MIGHQIKCKIVKNKIAVPYKEAIFDLYYGVGINLMSEIITVALVADIIHQGGAWFNYKQEGEEHAFKVQGRANLESYMQDNPEIAQEIKMAVLERLNA